MSAEAYAAIWHRVQDSGSERSRWKDTEKHRANDRYIVYTVTPEKRAKEATVRRGIIDGSYCEVLNTADLIGKEIVTSGQTFVNNNALLNIINK